MPKKKEVKVYERIVIMCASLDYLDFHSNHDRTSQLREELLKMGLSFVGVKVNGVTGFLVSGNLKLPRLVKLAKAFGQREIFTSDEKRDTHKINVLKPKDKVSCGALLRVAKDVKLKDEKKLNISFVENGTEFYFSTEL